MSESSTAPSAAVMRCGTEDPPSELQIVAAGPLRVTLDAGNLRYVEIGGREALRAAAFVARTDTWGTYVPEIQDLQIEKAPERFTITYHAVCKDANQELRYQARIEGLASGSLTFDVDLEPATDWCTGRTGFSILHGVAGIAGCPVDVVHTDGTEERAEFPTLIKPSQPIFDIRSLTHEVAPGTRVTCVMEGEAYEMEDHRNWSDASFKTYFRPLAKRPLPYTLAAGEKSTQSVTLTTTGELGTSDAGESTVTVRVGGVQQTLLPALGLAVAPEHAAAALSALDRVNALKPGYLVCHYNPALGHSAADMTRFAELGSALHAELWLEAVVPCKDSKGEYSGDEALMQADIEAVAEAATGVQFDAVIPSPLAYHKSYQPDGVWPNAPSLESLYRSVREKFSATRIGGGMHSYFTELNRKPPPCRRRRQCHGVAGVAAINHAVRTRDGPGQTLLHRTEFDRNAIQPLRCRAVPESAQRPRAHGSHRPASAWSAERGMDAGLYRPRGEPRRTGSDVGSRGRRTWRCAYRHRLATTLVRAAR